MRRVTSAAVIGAALLLAGCSSSSSSSSGSTGTSGALERANIGSNGFGDLKRGRAQRLGKREQRNGEVAEFDLRRLLNNNRRQSGVGVTPLQTLQHTLGKTLFQMTVQGIPLSY